MAVQPSSTTLVSAIWPARADLGGVLRAVLLAVAGTALLTLSAKLKVPFYPVPMTMQTLVVLMLGAAYGSRLGAATVALYLLEGALGLPVFADTPERGIGLAYMMGPTGGFLVGFLAGAAIVGWLCERGLGRSLLGMLAAMTIGHLAIFAFGYGWLATLVGPTAAWAGGVAPFFLATALKTALGAVLVPALWSVADRRRG
ncbi:biotin transporter BioY [Alsobacter sp. SYSU M60028]|uniref:Biotin transporter n=1 Tax=Alsobacter ponti TaxID=2962936 RepID=A0ABT1LCP9_9HYPH|nr:biotin transporter BioY [Alsobacter ponti]MCP8939282.1 biotin transporter BioY [Alsobacter ponti]